MNFLKKHRNLKNQKLEANIKEELNLIILESYDLTIEDFRGIQKEQDLTFKDLYKILAEKKGFYISLDDKGFPKKETFALPHSFIVVNLINEIEEKIKKLINKNVDVELFIKRDMSIKNFKNQIKHHLK